MDSNQMGLELVAPFLSKSQITELCSGRLWEEYRRRKMEIFRRQLAQALWRQRECARLNAQRETRYVDGLGRHKMKVDDFLHALMRRRYGDDCWQDPDFQNDCWKKTPELRVPAPAPRVRINGFRAAGMVPGENPRTAGASALTAAHETPAARVS